jgi:circadian clock protein KaiC
VMEAVTTGVGELDALLGGGLDRGTSTLIVGPSGAGKSTIALGCINAAAARGECVLMVAFDETKDVLFKRAFGVGVDLAEHERRGHLLIEQVDPADLSPGELSGRIRRAVEERRVSVVVVDSLTGYMNAMPEEQFVILQMHEMLTYLNQQGVVTILILAQHGMVGQMSAPIDMTYVSDTVLLLRFFEAQGRIRRAVSVMKKRTGAHEDTIRELRIDSGGLRVGTPLDDFRGVLTGVPTYQGERAALMKDRTIDGAA